MMEANRPESSNFWAVSLHWIGASEARPCGGFGPETGPSAPDRNHVLARSAGAAGGELVPGLLGADGLMNDRQQLVVAAAAAERCAQIGGVVEREAGVQGAGRRQA